MKHLSVHVRPAVVSVVIPAYNAAAYVAEAVESIRAQAGVKTEIIVVDDGSTDATGEVVAQLGVRCHRQENAGPAAALNRGASLAGGSHIAFLSADDLWVPQKLAWQMKALAAGPSLVFGHLQHFLSPELEPAVAARLRCPAAPMAANSAGTMLAPIEMFRAVGALNESFRSGEFLDWYGRAVDLRLPTIMLPEVLLMRRVHGDNHSLKSDASRNYTRVLKAVLDRRRQEKEG